LLMSSTFWLFHISKRNFGKSFGNYSFIIFWLAFEYMYLNAEISWPWLTLGNGFAKDISLIQWYEYTGALGGSFWVLLVNILLLNLFYKISHNRNVKYIIFKTIPILLIILMPIITSIYIFNNYTEKNAPYSIGIIQPNIDPYNEKFGGLSSFQQLDIITDLSYKIANENIDYIIGPETALNTDIWENHLAENYSIKTIGRLINKFPNINFVIGMDSYKRYFSKEEYTKTVRKVPKQNIYYDSFNAAVQIDSSMTLPVYYKSKLVVGVEKMPYPKLFKRIEKAILDLGGTTGSRGTQKNRETFKNAHDSVRIAPIICYESIYGEYVTDYIKNGANLIFVITNDGWWKASPGYKQHLSYSQLRAIETRRSIARSANTGISCFINQKGEISKRTDWWVADAITGTINANNKITFYTRYGDYFGRIAGFLAVFSLLYLFVNIFIRRKTKNK
nr:apolipoprotein N-acyltransferase [Bacteroidales bacterium]